jgi:hypothetical protein
MRKSNPLHCYLFFKFYYEAFAEPLWTLSKKFQPETNAIMTEHRFSTAAVPPGISSTSIGKHGYLRMHSRLAPAELPEYDAQQFAVVWACSSI